MAAGVGILAGRLCGNFFGDLFGGILGDSFSGRHHRGRPRGV
ncbi:hypothetical protein ACFFX0_03605 [Citricoccus parietis]|uniref:Major facilitator superfamily (MFS) profile domain-containing protein n=1 Tax=Citricoccus parietis TaxID=592307 RepID=A0ABV5FVM2_9MICC